jgi:hypothetical protein
MLHSRDEAGRFDYRTRIHRSDNGPVNTGILTEDTAKVLFQL